MTSLALVLILAQTDAAPQTEPFPAEVEAPPSKPAELAPAPAPAAAPEPAPSPWSAGITAGLTWVTGNVASLSFVGGANALRKTDRTILNLKAFGAYGEKFADSTSARAILLYNAGFTAQFDLRFTPMFSAFMGAGLDTDHVKSVELRGFGDLGVGVVWLDTKVGEKDKAYQKALIKTDVSAHLQPESRFQYYPTPLNLPDALLFGPRVAALLHYAFAPTTYFHEEIEFVPNVLNETRFLVNSSSKAALGLISVLSLTATFTVKWDSKPAPGKLPTDTIFTLGLEATF
jgi:hypothetical protein